MIQHAGKISEKPYYIKEIDVYVSSLEEINYFVYNCMNLVYRDFFNEELFAFIENNLERKDLADQLRVMEKAGAALRELISYLLKESYYYDRAELSKVLDFVTNIDNLSSAERLKIEGDNLFRAKRYSAAFSIYLRVLNEEPGAMKEDFYADAAFSAGMCRANLFQCKSACAYFNMAYDIFPRDDYAKACVYVSLVLGDDEELLNAIVKYQISDEALERIRQNTEDIKQSILESEEFSRFNEQISDRPAAVRMVHSIKDEYYKMTE